MIYILVITVMVFGPPLLLAFGAKLTDWAGEAEWSSVQRDWDAELHRRYMDRFQRLR